MGATNRLAKTGAVFYVLWGLLHVAGAGFQLYTLRTAGGAGLTALVSSARALDAQAAVVVPDASAAFMGMGSMNILWVGMLAMAVGATLNWRNSRLGYWLNMGVVGATDTTLLLALLLPGIMAWSDGAIGISLFLVALVFSTLGRARSGAPLPKPQIT